MGGEIQAEFRATRGGVDTLQKLKLGVEHSTDAVFVTEVDGTICYVNPAFERMYGYSAQESIGQTPRILKSGILSVEDYQRFWEELLAKSAVEGEIVNKTKDGRLIHVRASTSPILDVEGQLIGFLAIHHDITEQKQHETYLQDARARLERENRMRSAELSEASKLLREQIRARAQVEHALFQSEERYRALVETSHVLIWTGDAQGRFSFVNEAAKRIYGCEPEEMIGRPFSAFSVVEQAEIDQEAISRALSGELLFKHETVHRSKHGSSVVLSYDIVPLRDAVGNVVGVTGAATDVTERAQAEEALEKRNRLLETLNELYKEAVSHLDPRKVFESTVEITAKLIGVTSAHVSEIDVEQGTTTVIAEYISPQAAEAEKISDLGVAYSMDADFGYSANSIRKLQDHYVIHVDDPALSPDELQHLKRYGAKSVLGIPIIVQSKPVAKIEFWESRRKRVFTDEDIELVQAVARQVAIPIENARLYAQVMRELEERKELERQIQESLERRSRQVRLSTQVTQDIVAATDLNDLYHRVVTRVKEQFGYYHVQLLRYDRSLDAVVLIAGYGEAGERMAASGHSMPIGVGLIGSAAESGRPVLRARVADDPDWKPNPHLPDTKGELAVPIKLGDEVLGVLDVQSDEAGALNEDDQLALEGLCGQIAIAIESTRLRQQMAERLHELDELQRMTSREGWRSYHAWRQSRVKGYRFDQASIQPLDADSSPHGGNTHPDENLETGEDPDGAHEAVAATMTVRGEVVGAIGVEQASDNPLTLDERELLESISVQVAEALESARLLEQTHKHATEMETVARVSAAASTLLDARQLLQTVTQLTKERFDLTYASIYVLDEEDRLSWAAGPDPLDESPESYDFPPLQLLQDQSPISQAAYTRQPVVANDVRQELGYLAQPLLPDTRSELAVPLIVGDDVLGVLDLQSDVVNRFGDDDVRIHATLAAQVAIALQNANLYAEQLETAERLREVDRLKSEFMASMSHELRTPLNSIIGFADVLLEGIDGPLNERMKEDVTLIRDSGRHLRELIGGILDMSKIEAGVMELRYEEVDVPQVAREVMATVRSLALDKDLRLELAVDPKLDTIEADRTRVTQILLNLMSNAIKFTEKGSVSLSMQKQQDELFVSVSDTGIGIREEDIPVIFEQFRQIDGGLTRRAGGTGLGMPISKSLVELHGGQMWVESAPGVGSTFMFTIPVHKQAKQKSQTASLRPPAATSS